jgi:hypothetical protein
MKKLLLASIGVLTYVMSISQTIEINDVKGNKFNGVAAIMNDKGESVSGYYTYYMVEKGDKGMRTLEFSIVDKGVTKVTKTQIEMHKNANLNNTVFNGKYFLVSYDDPKNKEIVVTVLDLEGNVFAKESVSAEKARAANSKVYPAANGDGFYMVRPAMVKNKIKGLYLEKISNKLETVWSVEDMIEKGFVDIATLVNNDDRLVVWREHGLGIKKLKPQIVCYDAKTGKPIFSRDGYDGESTILYNQIRIDESNNVLIGGAYVDGEKYKTVNNTGIYLLKLAPDGKELFYTKILTKEQIQPVLKKISTGIALGSKDKVWIEDLIIDGDEIIIISEMFRKNFNMTPMAVQTPRDLITGKYIGDIDYRDGNGKAQKVTFEIMDYILFSFTDKGDLEEIIPIKKDDYNKLTVYYPYVGLYGMAMAQVVEQLGWFDYGFTTTNSKGEKIMVCSNNSEARKPQVFTYKLKGDQARTEINLKQAGKIDLEKGKVSYFKSMRNENGRIAVAYYQRKLKRITINLESIEN